VRLRRDTDVELLDLFEEAGRNALRTTEVLHALLRDHPEAPHLPEELVHWEHEGDRITHAIMQRLSVGDGLKPIMTLADGHALASALDDIVDFSEQTGDWLHLYAIEATMDQAIVLAGVLVDAAHHVSDAVAQLREDVALAPTLKEINRLENEADRLYREAVASLFANGIDPMVVIRWKDIFESVEAPSTRARPSRTSSRASSSSGGR
jgi:uncharacterized protein Yka (UPF0111/DUF47 family)